MVLVPGFPLCKRGRWLGDPNILVIPRFSANQPCRPELYAICRPSLYQRAAPWGELALAARLSPGAGCACGLASDGLARQN